VLLPRLNDGAGSEIAEMFGGGATGQFLETLTKAMSSAQQELIEDLRKVTAKIAEQATNLERRADAHANQVAGDFSKTMIKLREELSGNLEESVTKTRDYVGSLASGLQGLNNVLRELGEKQVIIQQVKKKGWFGG
jgi:DNA anti-recombination protein RmuC